MASQWEGGRSRGGGVCVCARAGYLAHTPLDRVQEARNSARVAAMFRGQRDVYVPPIFNELSTRRVLTMEFVRGVKPTNAEALAAIGVSGREVAAKASRVFGDMIHVHGFVHCDPHPGNLLVRKDVEGNTQLVSSGTGGVQSRPAQA